MITNVSAYIPNSFSVLHYSLPCEPAAPSPPINVMLTQVSPSSLAVSWTLSNGVEVKGCEVFVCDIATGTVTSTDVPNPTNTNLVLIDLQADTVYSVWLVAYGEHLPSLPTKPANITLNGMTLSSIN